MLKENLLYEDALELVEKTMQGKKVDQLKLSLATIMLKDVWTAIYLDRQSKEISKKADEWVLDKEKED